LILIAVACDNGTREELRSVDVCRLLAAWRARWVTTAWACARAWVIGWGKGQRVTTHVCQSTSWREHICYWRAHFVGSPSFMLYSLAVMYFFTFPMQPKNLAMMDVFRIGIYEL